MDHLRIRYEDIKSATSDFSQGFIGSGGYGKVYKAQLHHFDRKNSKAKQGKNLSNLPKVSNTVAIKKIFDRDDTQAGDGFSTEIKALTSCMHPNIVSLVGFCDEDSHMILVYEFITKGSLDDYLKRNNLRWIQRLEMCLHIAQGLKYLHTEKSIIHRDIKSANILLDDNLVPKIADFGLAKDGPKPQQSSSIETVVAGTWVYLDPDYEKTNKLKKASDIYSFGVVMFEMLTGKLAYTTKYKDRLSYFVQEMYREGKLKDELDAKLKEEEDENNFTLAKGPNQDSLNIFLRLISQCLEETQTKRPTIEDVIKELKDALDFQENHNDNLKISLEDIKSAVNNFSNDNYVAEGGFGSVYKGEVTRNDGRHTIVAKRWHNFTEQGDNEFFSELEILLDYKHKNVIGLVGYCNEENEKIIVYEYVPRGTLRMQLKDTNLTWMNRLKISIDIACGIHFLHAGGVTNEVVMHRDIKSSHILLDDDWQAKVTGFGLSCTSYINDFVIDDNASGTHGYLDPVYHELKTFTRESDIYSLGVVLFEILSGRSTNIEGKELLGTLAQKKFKKEEIDDLVFDGIKDQIVPKALTTFQRIALRCLHDKREERPTIGEVLQLKEALEFQEDYQKWQHKLPKDYEEILRIAHTPELYSTKKYKELYDIFCKGILLQEGDVFFALGDNGERIAMISATASFYINGSQYKFVPGSSRFPLVANMFDVLNLKIKVETRCQLLAQKVIYGVYLVFKFCDSREISSKPLYVNLKYQSSSKTSHAYFATKRDDEWMMIELWRFLNDEEVIDFNFLLKSFSPLYYGDSSIYVEGIEFRPIHDVNEVQQVSKSESVIMVQLQEMPSNNEQTSKRSDAGDKLFLLNGVKRKIDVVDSAKMGLNNLSSQSRSRDVIELPPQQIFHINGTINNKMLLRDTDYICYLVFKLLTEDDELHCPVKVQNLLNRKKEAEILYFKSPSSWNDQGHNRSPQLREDGWLEVKVWKFSFNQDLKNDQLHLSLRFISYEGTMPGFIVYGLEFRSI